MNPPGRPEGEYRSAQHEGSPVNATLAIRRPAAQGWCPGAYRPMASGDGLVVRVRPHLACLTAAQALGLCDAAQRFGSGWIDLTSRANLQLRGVPAPSHGALIEALAGLGLLDANPAMEVRRNLLVTPLWRPGDATARLATELTARLIELPALPPKFGFAVDAGPAPVLSAASADIRIERAASGGLIVRADGAEAGQPVHLDSAVDAVIALAHGFVASGGAATGRMARHRARLDGGDAAARFSRLPGATGTVRPAAAGMLPAPGASALGPVFGVAFGQLEAAALARLLQASGAHALRLMPGRLLLLEGARCSVAEAAAAGLLTRADDPLLRVDACPGAPACASATVATRPLARALAPLLAGLDASSLHVSGCAKGCARAGPADLTLVGRGGAFDLVRHGRAWDTPVLTGLSPDAVRSHLHRCLGAA